MRHALVRSLLRQAETDPRLLFLTGDLGYSVVEPFVEKFPGRFFNVGVAEQNMLGIATGLAEAGFVPFVYSITPFATLRPFEFLRNGPALHNLPVRVVGIGEGFDYGLHGYAHHALEDIAVTRALPGFTVIAPADANQLTSALDAIRNLRGPVYLRLGKESPQAVPGLDGRFRLGRAERLREGRDLLFIATGATVAATLRAAEQLTQQGIDCGVLVAACLAPIPRDDLIEALKQVPLALTVEAHFKSGGLGSLTAEVLTDAHLPCRLIRCGVDPELLGTSGSTSFLNARHGFDAAGLVETARRALDKTL